MAFNCSRHLKDCTHAGRLAPLRRRREKTGFCLLKKMNPSFENFNNNEQW